MDSDTKVIIGVIVATALVIGGGAWWASRTPAQTQPTHSIAPEQAERLVREDDPVLGATDAKVMVVEFGDFQCPACGSLHPVLKQVKEDFDGQSVQFIYRQFPLVQIHEYAQLAAEASLEAQAHGKFWEYHDLLFENQTRLERADLERYADQVGLELSNFQLALDERTHQDAVAQDVADGRALGVRGTPTLYINGTQYTGQYSPAGLGAAIEAALAS